MTFLSPLLLWFLAAVSVPVIIHLLNKRRHKTLQWAAMQFLLKATRESRGKRSFATFSFSHAALLELLHSPSLLPAPSFPESLAGALAR